MGKRRKRECDICGEFVVALPRHKRTHTDRPFQCKLCVRRKFFTQNELNEHITSVHMCINKCNICGDILKTKFDLKRHVQKHTTLEKPFKCKYCESKFVFNKDCVAHERIHSNKTPYMCKCGKAYRTHDSLWQHVKHYCTYIDNNPQTFKCDSCSMVFKSLAELRDHKPIHYTERNFKCEYTTCDRSFNRKIQLYEHYNRVHDIPSKGHAHNCNVCLEDHFYSFDYKGAKLCKQCYKNETKCDDPIEHIVVEYINKHFDFPFTSHDKPLTMQGGCSTLRPDLMYVAESFVLVVEIDQGQHCYYTCEESRITKIHESLVNDNGVSLPLIVIRFNPNDVIDNTTICNNNDSLDVRCDKLITQMQTIVSQPTFDDCIKVYYMYYDKVSPQICKNLCIEFV